MKRSMSTRVLSLCSGLILLISVACNLSGATTWQGTSTPDVVVFGITETLNLDNSSGDIELKTGGTLLKAEMGGQINVNLMNAGSVTIKGNSAAPSQLYINAITNGKVLFKIDKNLTFNESANNTPLLIVVSGDGTGTVEFDVAGGSVLAFSSLGGVAGTQLYVYMDTPGANNAITTLFFNHDVLTNPGVDATVQVGAKSVLGYLAILPTAQGRIKFDAKLDANNGRLVLDEQNTGAVIITGQGVTNGVKTGVVLSDIKPEILAGQNAIFSVVNGTQGTRASGLLITNHNNTLSNLQLNPCCLSPNPFNGVLYGFILSANGTLDIQDNSYVDYVGLTNNQCPPCGTPPSPCDFGPELLIKKRNASAFIVDGSAVTGSVPARVSFGNCSALFFRSGVNVNGVIEHPLPGVDQYTIDPLNRTPGEGETVFDVEGPLNVTGQPTLDPVGLINVTSKLEILSLEVPQLVIPYL